MNTEIIKYVIVAAVAIFLISTILDKCNDSERIEHAKEENKRYQDSIATAAQIYNDSISIVQYKKDSIIDERNLKIASLENSVSFFRNEKRLRLLEQKRKKDEYDKKLADHRLDGTDYDIHVILRDHLSGVRPITGI